MSNPIAAPDLGAIRRRTEAATPEPWQVDGPWWHNDGAWSSLVTAGEARTAVAIAPPEPSVAPRAPSQAEADIAFIAAARTDVLALLAAVDRLTAERDRWKARAEWAEERVDGQAWVDLEAERDRLAAERDEARAKVEKLTMYERVYEGAEKALDEILGPNEEDGAGGGLVGEIWLIAEQRDEARAQLDAAQPVLAAAKVRAQVLRDCRQFGSGSEGWPERDRESDRAIERAVDAWTARQQDAATREHMTAWAAGREHHPGEEADSGQ